MDAKTVLSEEIEALRPQMLMVVDVGPTRQIGKANQQIGQSVAGDHNWSRAGKREKAPRLYVAKRVLLNTSKVTAKLYEMPSASIGRVIQNLEAVGHAMLRIVVLIAEGRITRHGDVAQSRVAWIG